MKKHLILLLILLPFILTAQNKITISGYAESLSDKERLPGATLFAGAGNGVATNNYGFYSLTIPAGSYTITCRYVGYKSVSKELNLQQDTIINFQLPAGIELDE